MKLRPILSVVSPHWPSIVLSLMAGAVVRIWAAGKLPLYIHPSTLWIVATGAAVLLFIALRAARVERVNATKGQWIGILAITGILLLSRNVALSPALAEQRNTGYLLQTTSRTLIRPGGATQDFTILEWLAAWEGDPTRMRYANAPAKVTGFITEDDGAVRIGRYLITCCAVDVQLVQMPLEAKEGVTLPPSETWVTVTGTVKDRDGYPQLNVETVEIVDEPANPYLY